MVQKKLSVYECSKLVYAAATPMRGIRWCDADCVCHLLNITYTPFSEYVSPRFVAPTAQCNCCGIIYPAQIITRARATLYALVLSSNIFFDTIMPASYVPRAYCRCVCVCVKWIPRTYSSVQQSDSQCFLARSRQVQVQLINCARNA